MLLLKREFNTDENLTRIDEETIDYSHKKGRKKRKNKSSLI
jgi:hypothetical protein